MGEPGAGRKEISAELVAGAARLGLEDRCSLARWLLAMRFPERVHAIFSAEELAASEPAFLAAVDALAAQGRWKEARSLLNAAQRPSLDEAARQLFLAKVAEQIGEQESVDASWQAIRRNLPFSNPDTIRQTAAFALKTGRIESARQAIEFLVERKAATPGDFAELVRLMPSNTPALEALALFDKFLAACPQIPEARSDHAYLSLLAGRDIDASRATAGELFRKQPEYLAYLSVLALAELRLGHPLEAARLYEGRQITWNDAPAHLKVIRIAVLYANGHSSEAEALLATLAPATLRPEERELVRKPAVAPGSD